MINVIAHNLDLEKYNGLYDSYKHLYESLRSESRDFSICMFKENIDGSEIMIFKDHDCGKFEINDETEENFFILDEHYKNNYVCLGLI